MAITVGQPAPDFTLHENPATQHSLSDYRGKNVVLAFFPGAFTGVCTTEMCTLRDSIEDYNSLNAVVLGITVDPPFSLAAWKAANNVDYTFLSDYNREVVNAYDVALPGLAGLQGYVAAKRAVTIVDGEGIVRYHWVSDSPGNEPDYAEVRAAVAALN
ncbi:MAG: peroxiredoxin [Chloroflexi bacterium]|nr:peroxiredoxin [Chloroflexota bacterium]